MRKLLAALLLSLVPCYAALSASTVWELRTAGADTNGGGFVTGASGTDYSQNDHKNAAGCTSCGSTTNDISVTDGVTAGTTTITSATANFTTAIVGNIINVSGGTGSIVSAWYQVTARNSATSITVDRSTGLTTGTGVTINIGGALLSPGVVCSLLTVTGMAVWQKSGTYSITSTTANVAGGRLNVTIGTVHWEGYGTSRADLGTKPLIQASGIASTTLVTWPSNQSEIFRNVSIDGASLTSIKCLLATRGYYERIKVANCTNIGIDSGGSDMHGYLLEATNVTGGAEAIATGTGECVMCEADSNTVTGFLVNQSGNCSFCLSYGNSGASSDGFQLSVDGHCVNCIAYNNGRNGFRATSTPTYVTNGIAEANGAVGYADTGNTEMILLNCGDFNNTGGRKTFTGTISQDFGSIAASSTFFVAAGSNNFALNSTSTGGALARAAGVPGVYAAAATTGFQDLGVQHQATGGGPTAFVQ